jgi:hypothetical protein
MATYNKITQRTQIDTATPADSETASKMPSSIRQIKDFLKTFLAKAHNDDGTLKAVAVNLSTQLEDQVVRGSTANSAGSAQEIAQGTVSTPDLRDLAVSAAKLAADAVETAKIKDANVTAAKLASDAVETAKIKDVNVTAAKLATDAVETAKIKDLAVTTAKINDLAVSTGKIAANAVTYAKIQAVGAHKVLCGDGSNAVEATVGGVLSATYAAGTLTFAFSNSTAAGGSVQYARLDEKANSGTSAGASAAATWVQPRGNTTAWTEEDAAGILTITSGGSFSLKKGTYKVNAFAVGNETGLHQIRLRKVTATAATVLTGNPSTAPATVQTTAVLQGVITVAADSDEYQLQHYTTNAVAADGLGETVGAGEQCVFASIEFLKLA